MPDKRILVVDDEEELLELIKKALSSEGYDVTTVTSAEKALEKVKTYSPDLILIDIVLPDMDGPETVAKLSENPLSERIPKIFLSGILTRDNEDQSSSEIRVGEKFYRALSKPFSTQELMAEVRNAIG